MESKLVGNSWGNWISEFCCLVNSFLKKINCKVYFFDKFSQKWFCFSFKTTTDSFLFCVRTNVRNGKMLKPPEWLFSCIHLIKLKIVRFSTVTFVVLTLPQFDWKITVRSDFVFFLQPTEQSGGPIISIEILTEKILCWTIRLHLKSEQWNCELSTKKMKWQENYSTNWWLLYLISFSQY